MKSSYAVHLFLAKFRAILPTGMALELIHNRLLMLLEEQGGNISLDLRMEHLTKLSKIALRQLGANVSEAGAQRIARSFN